MARGPGVSLDIKDKRFSSQAEPVFSDFGMEVAAGEVLAVLGPSGVGKSTLLRLVAGIDRDFFGTITIGGLPASEAPPPGLVFQDARLLPWLTAIENVRLAPPGLGRADATALLARVGLPEAGNFYPRQMSGGMQRRVALARALGAGGGLLLLDEPFVSLDRKLAEEMHQLLREVLEGSGASVLLVTHDPGDAARLADRAVLLGGRPARIEREEVFAVPRAQRDEALVERYVGLLGR